MTMLVPLIVFVVGAALILAFTRRGPGAVTGPATPAEVQRLVAAGALIEAIKVYRVLTGCGLYEARLEIDRLKAGGAWKDPFAEPRPEAGDDASGR